MRTSRRYFPSPLTLFVLTVFGVTACGDDDDPSGLPPEGEEVTAPLPATGGQVSLGGGTQSGGVTINVPQGANTAPVQVTMSQSASSPQVPDPQRQGNVFQLGPTGTQFAAPVEVRLPYPAGFTGDPAALLMFTVDAQGRPEPLKQVFAVSGSFVSGQTTHFSPFWVSATRRTPTSVSVTPTSATLSSGGSATLTAVARNVLNEPLEGVSIQFSSDNADVASVSSVGVVTARKVGNTKVKASLGSLTAETSVTVTAGALAALVVSPSTAEVLVDSSRTFTVIGTDAAGNAVGSLQAVSWSSTNGTVATVTSSGVATGRAPGTTSIRASLLGITGSASMTVKPNVVIPPGVDSVLVVTPKDNNLRSGENVQLHATVSRSNGTVGAATGTTWASRDAAVASVNSAGVVTGLKVGTTWVVGSTAFAKDSAKVTVSAGVAAIVRVSPDSIEVRRGADGKLTATVTDANGNPITVVLGWTSANPAVASVNQEGVVIGVDLGTTTVTASASNGASGSAKVVVERGEPADFTFSPDPATVRAGQTRAITITPVDDRGRETQLIEHKLVTVVRDTSIVKIEGTNTVRGFKLGSTWLVASAGPVVDSVKVTTLPGIAVTTQFVSPSQDTTVTAGDTVQVTLQGTDGLGNVFTQTGFVLTSGNTATVETLTGLKFLGKKVGATSLSAKVDTVTKSINVTVVVGPAASVTITKPSVDTTMTSGASVGIETVVADRFGNVRGDPVALATDDAQVLALAGVTATAGKVGTATVTATSGALTDTRDFAVVHGAAVTVTFVEADGSASPATKSIGQLDSLQTQARGADAFGNLFSDGIAFTSTNPAVATISATGLVFGATIGTAKLIASRDAAADTIDLTVKVGALSRVDVTPPADTATSINDTLIFVAKGSDKAGNTATGVSWAWTLSNGAAAEILGAATSDTVKVRAKANGTTSVIASGTKEGTTRVDTATMVVKATAATVTITPDTATLEAVGGTVNLAGRVTAKDAKGNTIGGAAVTWASLNTSVATVNAAGVVTAVAGGTVGIVATVDAAKDTATITVDLKCTTLFINPVADTIPSGGTKQFTVKCLSGSTEIQGNIAWTSTATGVATVGATTGLATGVGAGVTKIIATSGTAADTAQLGVAGDSSIVSTAFPNGQRLDTLTAGQQVTLAVSFDMSRVSANGDLGSAQFDLTYDANVFQVSSATSTVSGTTDINTGTAGKVSFGFIGLSAQGQPKLTLATIVLQVKSGAATGRSGFVLNYTARPTNSNLSNLVTYQFPVAVTGEVLIN